MCIIPLILSTNQNWVIMQQVFRDLRLLGCIELCRAVFLVECKRGKIWYRQPKALIELVGKLDQLERPPPFTGAGEVFDFGEYTLVSNADL